MKMILQIIVLIAVHSCTQAPPAPAVYVGSTPCSQGTRPLPGNDSYSYTFNRIVLVPAK